MGDSRVKEYKTIADVKDSLAYADGTVICSKRFKLNDSFKVDAQLIVSGDRRVTRLSDNTTFNDEDLEDLKDGGRTEDNRKLRGYLKDGCLRYKKDEYLVEKSNGFRVRCEYIDSNTGNVVYTKCGDMLTDIEDNNLAAYTEHDTGYNGIYNLLQSEGAAITRKVLKSGVLDKKEREIPHIDGPEDGDDGPNFE
jgi:hypothetical protein